MEQIIHCCGLYSGFAKVLFVWSGVFFVSVFLCCCLKFSQFKCDSCNPQANSVQIELKKKTVEWYRLSGTS